LAKATALGGQSTLAGASIPAMQFQLAGPQNLATNPYLASATEAALRPIYTQTQGLLQQARRDATGAGQLGGTRQAILEQGVIGDYLTKATDLASNIYSDAYGDALKTQTAALSQVPGLLQSTLAPSQTLGAIGAAEQARQQQVIDDARARFEFGQQAPLTQLQNYAQLIGQNILPGTTTQTGGDPALNVMGGLAGAGIGYAAAPYLGGFGTAIGGSGLLAGLNPAVATAAIIGSLL
jgi:hypothetical protein